MQCPRCHPLEPSGIDGLQRGAVIWEVTEGTGQFAGAKGLITSNFAVGPRGEVGQPTPFAYSTAERPVQRQVRTSGIRPYG